MWPGFLLLVLLGLGEALFFFFGTLTLTFKCFIVGLILRVELRGLAIYFFFLLQ